MDDCSGKRRKLHKPSISTVFYDFSNFHSFGLVELAKDPITGSPVVKEIISKFIPSARMVDPILMESKIKHAESILIAGTAALEGIWTSRED